MSEGNASERNPPELVVVIPHHSQRQRLVAAVRAAQPWPVIVVDDGPMETAPLPGVEWIRTSGEEGFARAANWGLSAAAGQGFELALLLNDDAEPEPDCIKELLAGWKGADRPGAVGPILIEPDGAVLGGIALSPWGRVHTMKWPNGERAQVVPAVSGACMLVRTSTRFDSRFRHGMEDVALCRHLTRSGQQVLLVPKARCHHVGGATLSRVGAEAQRHAMSGHLLLVGGGWRTPVVVMLAMAQVLREGASLGRFKAVGFGVRDHFRRVDPVVGSDHPVCSPQSPALL